MNSTKRRTNAAPVQNNTPVLPATSRLILNNAKKSFYFQTGSNTCEL